MARKAKYWEPPFIQVPVNYLQQIVQDVVNITMTSIQTGIPLPNPTTPSANQEVVNLLNNIKDMIMPLSAQVQTLVDQVAASKSIEASSAAAMVQMVSQSKALADQLTAAVAAAGAAGMSAADSAAIVQAATDLHDSASALATAVPASVPPPAAPAPVIPPAAAPVVDPAAPAAAPAAGA